MGALPFVLIAVIEPTKIPLAGGLYRVRHAGWKFLIFIALIGLTFVTFETIFAGLERQVTNVTAIVTEGKDDVRSLEEDIKNLSDEKVRIESLSIEEETKGLEDQILKLKESRQGENENEQKGLQDQTERIELEIAKLEERKSDILKPFNDKIADFERQENQSLNTIDTLNNQLNNLSSQNDNENNERRKSIKSIEDGINRAKNLYSSGEVAQIRKLQAILNVAEDGRKEKIQKGCLKNG